MSRPLAVISLMMAFTAMTPGLRAEPYTTVLGDKKVTSVARSPTKGGGMSREELSKAARESVPINIVPTNPHAPDKDH
jgi:formaldehyde-activating enzyme involved in methanogenesis